MTCFRWSSLCLLQTLCLTSLVSGQSDVTDLTRVSESSGSLVVTSTVALIRDSCIFHNDFLYLRRLAHVSSHDGLDPHTFRSGFHGGIWQISESDYQLTKNMTTFFSHINDVLSIDWLTTSWVDLRKPLYSGVAAMLTLERLSPIPKSLSHQAEHYETEMSGNASEFLSLSQTLPSGCRADNLEIAFVLDESGSVSSTDFDRSKNFSANVIAGFNVSAEGVRVSVISFSASVRTHMQFLDVNTTAAVQDVIRGIVQNSGGTNTHEALDTLRTSIFTESAGSRKNAAKIAIIQTDGKSSENEKTITAAARLKEEGVIVFAIGIGSGIDEQELHAMASEPTCTHVRILEDFQELNSVIADIEENACATEIVVEKNTSNSFSCGERVTLRVELSNATSIITSTQEGAVDVFGSFLTSQPNAAFADFGLASNDVIPTVIYISDVSVTTLYVTVEPARSGNSCTSTFYLTVVDSSLVQKTGTSNTCIKNSRLVECTDLDYVRGLDFVIVDVTVELVISAICKEGGLGFFPHPGVFNKFVYCAEVDLVYVVTCPAGFAYSPTLQDCSIPISLHPGQICDVCSQLNWQIGMRKFPVGINTGMYVDCSGVRSCSVKECQHGYSAHTQSCGLLTPSPEPDCPICVINDIVLELDSSQSFSCSEQINFRIKLHKEATIVVQTQSGSVNILGSFIGQPTTESSVFNISAVSTKPTLVYTRDTDVTLFLSLLTDVTEDNRCTSSFHIQVFSYNVIHKTGVSTLCLKNQALTACSDLDFITRLDFLTVSFNQSATVTAVCQNVAPGVYPHPGHVTRFIYCTGHVHAYLVTCPSGLAYSPVYQDCVTPASVDSAGVCLACSHLAWDIGLRRLPVTIDAQTYVQCAGVGACSVRRCADGQEYLADDQLCGSPVSVLPGGQGCVTSELDGEVTSAPQRQQAAADNLSNHCSRVSQAALTGLLLLVVSLQHLHLWL